jgi:hypothetical protein
MGGLLTGFSAFDHHLRVLFRRLCRVTLELYGARYGFFDRPIRSALRGTPRYLFALSSAFWSL